MQAYHASDIINLTMSIRYKFIFFFILVCILFLFLYSVRGILTPFVLAAVFAYIFNPLVNFLSNKLRMPRTLSVALIYIIIMAIIVIASYILTKRTIEESSELRGYITHLVIHTKIQIHSLPDFAQGFIFDALNSIQKSKLLTSTSLFSLFPQIFTHILSFIIFLFSGFYFLKEGRAITDRFIHQIPNKYKVDVEILIRRINAVMGGYLRGQLLLIIIVSCLLFICLSILGERFSLILSIFSGFAEIVPIIGPITAGVVAALVILITGNNNFGLAPIQGVIVVGLIYFLVRQLQDYFITPIIMGKITKLPSIIILFSVLAGGHMFGVVGLILAVPIAATIRILLEYSLDIVNDNDKKNPRK